mgnify:CR=1 FL=1
MKLISTFLIGLEYIIVFESLHNSNPGLPTSAQFGLSPPVHAEVSPYVICPSGQHTTPKLLFHLSVHWLPGVEDVIYNFFSKHLGNVGFPSKAQLGLSLPLQADVSPNVICPSGQHKIPYSLFHLLVH